MRCVKNFQNSDEQTRVHEYKVQCPQPHFTIEVRFKFAIICRENSVPNQTTQQDLFDQGGMLKIYVLRGVLEPIFLCSQGLLESKNLKLTDHKYHFISLHKVFEEKHGSFVRREWRDVW